MFNLIKREFLLSLLSLENDFINYLFFSMYYVFAVRFCCLPTYMLCFSNKIIFKIKEFKHKFYQSCFVNNFSIFFSRNFQILKKENAAESVS